MRVDVHAHYLPAAYMDLLRRGDGPTFGAAHDDATLHGMIEGQDAAGIDVQILSTGPNSPYLRDEAAATAAARTGNDAFSDVVDRFGGRFQAFGSVPLPHGDAAAAEAVRCLDELGFAGIHLGCSARGHALDHPAFTGMWTELDRREAVVFIHPGGILVGTEPGLAGMDDPLVAVTIGSAAELATAALRLAALCRTFPNVRIIIGLLGGALPFLLQRVLWLGSRWKGASFFPAGGGAPLLEELRRFSYDTNLLPDPAALAAARDAYGIDRLLFGSDAPSGLPETTAQFMRDGGLTAEACDAVLAANPARLFAPRPPGLRGRLRAQPTVKQEKNNELDVEGRLPA